MHEKARGAVGAFRAFSRCGLALRSPDGGEQAPTIMGCSEPLGQLRRLHGQRSEWLIYFTVWIMLRNAERAACTVSSGPTIRKNQWPRLGVDTPAARQRQLSFIT